jgi:hypothetical protein
MNTGERKGAIRLGCAAIATVLGLLGGMTSARAQVTTTVLGTVQDAQGGVLPGASVELISETRGTKSEPVFTRQRGRCSCKYASRSECCGP